ncbi:hypothetical protein ABKA04_007886 [Annulohypoxylon sp. FPYF3050]
MPPSPRFIVNHEDLKNLRTVDANQEFLASLGRITTDFPPVHTCSTGWKFEGLYNGPTSIAYLFYRLSQIFPDMEFKEQSLLDWAESYLALGARRTKTAPSCTDCGITNETLAHLSLTAVMNKDINIVRQVLSFDEDVNNENLTGVDEWMYGRAGYLYFLRLCKTLVKETEDAESSTTELMEKTIKNTMFRIQANSPTHYWHGKEYFGAAHGTVGMVTQLYLTSRLIAEGMHDKISSLIDMQLPSGNFPPHARGRSEQLNPPDDQLVQFCHGAPGFNIALRSLIPIFPETVRGKLVTAMENADLVIWRRGVLTKNPCLCHGIPSNALALSDATHEEFLHFLSWMSTEEMQKRGWLAEDMRNVKSAGLYTGEAGRAWAWAVAVSKGPRVLIGFNDI